MSHRTVIKSPPTYSFPHAPLLPKLNLYPFQREAVKKMRGYLAAYSQKDTRGSGLVYMPTGTGKTAVIAALAQCIPEIKTTLILVPRTVLRSQIVRELKGPIFEKLNLPPGTKLKRVYRLDDKQIANTFVTALPEKVVIVSTIQKLESLKKHQPRLFTELIEKADLIIFDEGHYEPSPHWSDTVRRILKPRVIFTATPFRNDLKSFDIDPDHGYIYSFHKAVAQHYVRNVNITDVTPKDPLDAMEFVTHIMKFYKTYSEQKLLHPDARIIIRCDDASQVGHIADALSLQGVSYVAIHDTFKDSSENGTRWKHVPNPQETDALVWIHQYKLIEGIDDRRFQLLAVFGEGPDSARPFIQQIGRIIRNPDRDGNSKAYVLDTTGGILKKQWSGYLAHDRFVEKNGLQALDPHARLQRALLEAQLPVYYIDRYFRTPFSMYGIKPETDIQLPLKTNVFYKREDFDMQKVAEKLAELLQKNDCEMATPEISDERCLIVSVRYKDSPYLTESYFVEPRLCVTLIRLAGEYVCFYDSDNLSFNSYFEFGVPVAPLQLRRLLSGTTSCEIRQVSLKNSRVNPDAVQRRSLLTNSSIERTPLAFDDPNYICTSAEAYIDYINKEDGQKKPGTWRYIGFNKARLSDGSWIKYYPLPKYERWLEKIVSILKKPSAPSIQGLARYAMITEPPINTRPMIAVLDAYEVRDLYKTTRITGTSIEPADIYQSEDDVEVTGNTFHVQANGKPVDIEIHYDAASEKYRLVSAQLDRMYEPIAFTSGGIIDKLNKEQAFRVIPDSHNVIYAAGAFHDPQIGIDNKYSDKHEAILSTIKDFSAFDSIISEKGRGGTLPGGLGWEENSLFGLIDRLGGNRLKGIVQSKEEQELSQYFRDIELLVCDDMGTELADFIMIQSMPVGRKNVVFIHCKALDPAKKTNLSASSLAEVCSQAIKNLGELDNFAQSATNRVDKWSKLWDGGKLGTVNDRIRKGATSGKYAWDYLRETIENPNTRRETWLFLGNLLSKSELENRLDTSSTRSPKPPPVRPLETLQALYELYSTLCTIRSRDSGLYIFCNR